jgi:hypothetical protein
VKIGFLRTSSTLIPADITTVDGELGFIEVSQSKSYRPVETRNPWGCAGM